jgi:hypothetical protein
VPLDAIVIGLARATSFSSRRRRFARCSSTEEEIVVFEFGRRVMVSGLNGLMPRVTTYAIFTDYRERDIDVLGTGPRYCIYSRSPRRHALRDLKG